MASCPSIVSSSTLRWSRNHLRRLMFGAPEVEQTCREKRRKPGWLASLILLAADSASSAVAICTRTGLSVFCPARVVGAD